MLTTRLMAALFGCMVINLNMTTCRSPGEPEKSPPDSAPKAPTNVELPGVDTSELTPREKAQWSAHVSELLAPCAKVPFSVAECVKEKKDCAACEPAASYLASQVRRGLTHGQVEAAYQARFAADSVVELDVTDVPFKGPVDAPITIVEFADFECPACRAASPVLETVISETKDVRLAFKNFPLSIHEHAETAARASVAARNQGKFWEMHHLLFETQPPLAPERLRELAKTLELDLEKFDADMRSEQVADAVKKDRKEGERVKIAATPTIFVNGRSFDYADDLKSELLAWIELERKLLAAPKK